MHLDVTLGYGWLVNPQRRVESSQPTENRQIQGAKSNVQDEDTLEKPHLWDQKLGYRKSGQKSGKSSQPRKRIGYGFFPPNIASAILCFKSRGG